MVNLNIGGSIIPCRGILFDKDGTLVHFMALWGGWADEVLRMMEERLELMGAAFTVPRDKVLGTCHDAAGMITGYDVQGPLAMGTAEETSGLLAWQLYAAGMPWNEALLQVSHIAKNAMYKVRQQKPAYPMPGLASFLEACSKAAVPLAVVTSDTTKDAEEHLRWMGASSFFSEIIGRDLVTNGKPHPEMVETACRRLGIEPGEAVVIGDSNGDMQMAKQAGAAAAIGIYQPEIGSAHLIDADIAISDYNEITIAVL